MRPGGPLGSATAVGSSLALLISHNFLCNKKKDLTDHILLFLGLTASILTETRAVLIVFAFISVWYPICKSNKSLAFLPKIIMVMLSGLFIWYLLPNDFSIKARFIDLIAGKLDDSTAWRLQAWKAAIDVRWQSPIWGVGLGNFKYYMENIPLYPALPHAHNIFLFLFAECGLIAFMLFLIFIGYLLKGIYKSYLAKEKLGLFLCFMIVGSVDIIPLFPPCLFIGAYLASRLISFNTLAKRPDQVEF
jgi:O-antigen ligase